MGGWVSVGWQTPTLKHLQFKLELNLEIWTKTKNKQKYTNLLFLFFLCESKISLKQSILSNLTESY